jgi:transposase-like protein
VTGYVDMTPFGHCGPCPQCGSTFVCRRLRDVPGSPRHYYHCDDCSAEWVEPTEAQLAGDAWREQRIREFEMRTNPRGLT